MQLGKPLNEIRYDKVYIGMPLCTVNGEKAEVAYKDSTEVLNSYLLIKKSDGHFEHYCEAFHSRWYFDQSRE